MAMEHRRPRLWRPGQEIPVERNASGTEPEYKRNRSEIKAGYPGYTEPNICYFNILSMRKKFSAQIPPAPEQAGNQGEVPTKIITAAHP